MHQDALKIIQTALDRPVVLVGMMGAGKSHLGRMLADSLALDFHDTDSAVVARAGMEISEIFAHYGEAKFREAERNAIAELIAGGPCVMATGGGALTSPETLEILEKQSWMIWLNPPLDILWARVKMSKNRPLLQTEDPKGTLAELMAARRPLYAQAHIHLDIGHERAERTLERLIKTLSERVKAGKVSTS